MGLAGWIKTQEGGIIIVFHAYVICFVQELEEARRQNRELYRDKYSAMSQAKETVEWEKQRQIEAIKSQIEKVISILVMRPLACNPCSYNYYTEPAFYHLVTPRLSLAYGVLKGVHLVTVKFKIQAEIANLSPRVGGWVSEIRTKHWMPSNLRQGENSWKGQVTFYVKYILCGK